MIAVKKTGDALRHGKLFAHAVRERSFRQQMQKNTPDGALLVFRCREN